MLESNFFFIAMAKIDFFFILTHLSVFACTRLRLFNAVVSSWLICYWPRVKKIKKNSLSIMSHITTHVTTMDHLGMFLHKVKRPIATFFFKLSKSWSWLRFAPSTSQCTSWGDSFKAVGVEVHIKSLSNHPINIYKSNSSALISVKGFTRQKSLKSPTGFRKACQPWTRSQGMEGANRGDESKCWALANGTISDEEESEFRCW